jgi:hypothetical protein
MPLLSVRPQFKPISLQRNLDPPFFAFCSPHPASLTQLDSSFNIQFLRCPEGIEYSRHRAVHPRHQCRGFSRWIGKLSHSRTLVIVSETGDLGFQLSPSVSPHTKIPRSGRDFAAGSTICETGLDSFQNRGEEPIAWMHPRQRAQVRSTHERRRVIPV